MANDMIDRIFADMDRRFAEVKELIRESSNGLKEMIEASTLAQTKSHDDHERRLRLIEEWKAANTGVVGFLKFAGLPFLASLASYVVLTLTR